MEITWRLTNLVTVLHLLIHGLHEVDQLHFTIPLSHGTPDKVPGDPVKGLLQAHERHVERFLYSQAFLL